MPKYLHLLGRRRLRSGPLGTFQEYLKAVEDLPEPPTLENTAILPPQTEITAAERDYLCIKSPLKIKSLANGAARGKGSGRG